MLLIVLINRHNIREKIIVGHPGVLYFDAYLFGNIFVVIYHVVVAFYIGTNDHASCLFSVNRILYDERFLRLCKTIHLFEVHKVFLTPLRIIQFFGDVLVNTII